MSHLSTSSGLTAEVGMEVWPRTRCLSRQVLVTRLSAQALDSQKSLGPFPSVAGTQPDWRLSQAGAINLLS